jgi:hypothetical protein
VSVKLNGAHVHAVVIGAQKCGTSALWDILSLHDELTCHSEGQFPRFYLKADPIAELDLSLKTLFPNVDTDNEKIVLRDTAIGARSCSVASIISYFPKAKIIFLVRDRAERCFSAFNYARSKGFEDTYAEFDEMVDDWISGNVKDRDPPLLNYIQSGMYADIVGEVIKAASIDRLMVIESRELLEDQSRVCKRLFEFLNIGFIEISSIRSNVSSESRFQYLNSLIRSDGIHKKLFRKVVGREKRMAILRSLRKINSKDKKWNMTPEQYQRVNSLYGSDKADLERLLGTTVSSVRKG